MIKKYVSFAAYLEDLYYNFIFERLKSYIASNWRRMNLSTYSVPDPVYVELNDFHIMGITFHEGDKDAIEFLVTVQTDVEISGSNKHNFDTDSTEFWLSIAFAAVLRDGLHNVRIIDINEYSKERFKSEDSLTKYLVPYIYAKDLDFHAEKFLKKYCSRALEEPMALPIKEIIAAMGLNVYIAPLSDGIFGRTYFKSATVNIYDNPANRSQAKVDITSGTILVNPDTYFMRNIGSVNNTIIHECVHWEKHYKFFEMQKLLNPENSSMSCAIVEDYKKGTNELTEELEWMEWQANALAPKILIPAQTGRSKLIEILNRLNNGLSRIRSAYIMELAISEFADFFKVSTAAAKIRAIELGFEQAAGVFNFVDNRNYPPFSFAKGSLKKDQTFIIDRNNAIFEATFNADISEDIKAGNFIHAGGMFVINDPQYVCIEEGSEATLTEYALEHVDECCLVFSRMTRVSNKYDDSFYRICFLCRDADSKSFVEAKYNRDEGKNEDVVKRAREMISVRDEAKRVQDIMSNLPSSFCGTLNYHINRRNYTNEKAEERSGISARTIQDYRKKFDAKPTLQSVLALCIGLNLQPAFSYDLILKSGYNIMIATEENLIYRYLIEHHHMESIIMWNQKLRDAGISQQLPKNGNKNTSE